MSEGVRPSSAGEGPETPPAGFGLATATFVVVSSMVGVGILTTSGHTVALVGSNALMLGLWAVGGLIALCGALSLAELAAMLPRSGGDYVFLREAYGPRMAFVAGWSSLVLGFAAPAAAASWAAAAYLLGPIGLREGDTAWWARRALATAAIVGFAAIHTTARRRTARAQGVVTGMEIAFLVGFVAAGVAAGRANLANLDDLPKLDARLSVELLFSLIYVSYGYTGWNAAAYLAGEVAEPSRRLPLAILVGTLGVTALYLGINLVYALALSAARISAIVRDEGRDAIAPIAERAALALFGPGLTRPFSIGVGTILLATTSAYLLTGPRVIYAMARAGHLPAVAGRLTRRQGTPAVATTGLAGLALVLLWSGSFDSLVVYAGVGLALSSMLSVSAVYVLRARRPDLPRPFRVPGYPVVPGVYLAGTAVVVAAAFVREPGVSCLSAATLVVALPAYGLRPRPGGLAGRLNRDTLDSSGIAADRPPSALDSPSPTTGPDPR